MKLKSIISISKLIAITVLLICTTNCVNGMTNERKAHSKEAIPETTIKETPAVVCQNVSTIEDSLITFIRSIQNRYVRKSYTETDCFTDIDYQNFITNNATERIKNEIRENREFIALVNAIRNLTPEKRDTLLQKAKDTCQKTWAQQGAINSDGQTNAGQDAQKDIAKAIVALIKTLL